MRINILPTALLKVYINNEFIGFFRAMSDSGSHVNLVRYNAFRCKEKDTKPLHVDLLGISENTVRIRKQVTVYLEPWFGQKNSVRIKTTFMILPKTSQWTPVYPDQHVPCAAINEPLTGPLADPLFWKPDVVPLLLGIEVYAAILEGMAQKVSDNLISQETMFGNMILGRAGKSQHNESAEVIYPKRVHIVDLQEIDNNLQRFWEFEELSLCDKKDLEQEMAEQMFSESHYWDETGRHVVKIPIKPQISELGSSREIALTRFFMLKKRGQRDPEFWQQYVQFMREYESLGHMIEADGPPEPGSMVYYIPHHGIKSGQKFRVVFDGSCLTDKDISLNDAQFIGPKLQRNLHEIIMRFRRHKIAISADISKMYRQIGIVPEQWNLQRIFFRESANQPLKPYPL